MSESEDNINRECTGDDAALTGRERSLTNLRKWRPGESGNPLGRKPRGRFCDVLGEALGEPVDEADTQSKTKLRAIVDTLIQKCIAGDSKCLTIFVQHADPARVRAAIKAGSVNSVNILNVSAADPCDLRDELESFVRTLPDVLRDAQRRALPGGMCDVAGR